MSRIKISGLWLIFLFFYFIYKVYAKAGVLPFDFSWESTFTLCLSVALLYSLVELSFFFIKNKKTRSWVLSIFTGLYTFLGFYHYKTTSYFDFSILADHWLTIWRPGSFMGSMKVASSIFGTPDYVRTIIAALVMYGLCQRDGKSSSPSNWRFLIPAALSVIYLTAFATNPVDEFSSIAKSAFYRVLDIQTSFQSKYKPRATEELPLVRTLHANHASTKPPHIFFLFIESVNARFIEAASPQGQEFTPYYNQLIKQGMYFQRFYAQSIQTGRAHFASLCGLTPSIYGKEFERFNERELHCLPEILRENGYFTIFSKANEDVNFDNTYNFTTQHGFQVMNSMSRGCGNKDKDLCWGWGIPDNIFYKRFFSYLKEKATIDIPVFATLATISSHMPFNEVPENQRYIYKNPSNRLEYYSNALRVTDEYLKTFFEELKQSPYGSNAIVFLMGDHSFPMGEHSNFQNENFAFEENFRTPLLILDLREKKVVTPVRVETAYSQINLAATALDLVGISTQVHFQGDSLLNAAPSYIHLVQPYGGVYFSVIKYPFKYVLYDRTQKESIFDLSKDPQENANLIDQWKGSEDLEKFRREVGKIWFNYDLMVQNRVWDQDLRGLKKRSFAAEANNHLRE